MKRKLITSALPYVNNVPHLGNLIQILSADVFARFARMKGYETLYICGTDEYGTASETKAQEEGVTPKELCDRFHALHREIYAWFSVNFDYFGRTSDSEQSEITQSIFRDLDKRGFISEHKSVQLYCRKCDRFLADRYIKGTCPKCGYEGARGDQCESCGKLLEPTELIDAKCSGCSCTPLPKETQHLYIDLPKIQTEYLPWMEKRSVEGKWSLNATEMTKAWIKSGLKERAITRDLKWGISVPREGYEKKVFYVWFDAPIGYISITKALENRLKAAGKTDFDYRRWWLPEEIGGKEEDVELFQFIGKDNIPFHTVIFPSSLIGSGRKWTKLFHLSSSEYLNYEDGKFSKSNGIGVFGSDAMESGIKADAWRFYIFYNRPERSDFQFTWKDFAEKMNSILIGNLGNLVNRTLLFVTRYFDGKIPGGEKDESLWQTVREKESKIIELLENAELKDAFHLIFELSDIGNKAFQSGEPWKTRNGEARKCASLIYNLCYLIKDLLILSSPYMPNYANKVASFFSKKIATYNIWKKKEEGAWDFSDLGQMEGLETVANTEIYFTPMDKKTTEKFREKFSGTQKEREEKEAFSEISVFNSKVKLTVAKIIQVERNPSSDKLFVEHLDDGSGNERVIQSGLVGFITEEELEGKHVILVENLKPRKMRGIESRGMLLAADYTDDDGKECVEVLEAPWAPVGSVLVLEGEKPCEKESELDADTFFKLHLKAVNGFVELEGKKLLACGKAIETKAAKNAEIH